MANSGREIVSDANEKSGNIDLSYDTKRKSITKMDMKETFGLPARIIILSMFTSETIGRLFVEMSLIETVEMKRCYIALDYDIYHIGIGVSTDPEGQRQRRTTWTRRRVFTHAAVGRVENACVNSDDRTR